MSSIPIFSSRFILLLFIVVVFIWLPFATASSTNNKNMNGPQGWNQLLQRMNVSDYHDGNATSSSSATSGNKQQQHPQQVFWLLVGAIGFCALALACFIGGYSYHRRIAKLHQEEEVFIEMGEKSAEEIEELKRQLLASQQKVEELTKENGKLNEELQQQNARLIAELKQQKLDFEGRIAKLQMEYEEILKGLGKEEEQQIRMAKEEESQIMPPMHEMKIQLPNEDWFNVLAFVPRRQLGKAAYQVGDRQFARILQLFLHDEVDNKVTLGRMEVVPPRLNVPSDRPMLLGWYDEFAVDLPDWPMPTNIKNFEEIILIYVDMSVVDFLRKFQANSLLANVRLHIDYGGGYMLQMLRDIHPLISSIDSITFRGHLWAWAYNNSLFTMLSNQPEEFRLQLKTIVEQTRILSIKWYTDRFNYTWEDKIDYCCTWLYSPKDDGKPRALIIEIDNDDNEASIQASYFVERIKKDFEESDHAVNFFIRLTISYFGDQAVPENFQQQEISLYNEKTNEKLVVKAAGNSADGGRWLIMISRHSSKAAKHKIEKEEIEIIEWDHFGGAKRIHLDRGE